VCEFFELGIFRERSSPWIWLGGKLVGPSELASLELMEKNVSVVDFIIFRYKLVFYF
jgi:hypothetical protein